MENGIGMKMKRSKLIDYIIVVTLASIFVYYLSSMNIEVLAKWFAVILIVAYILITV